MTINAHDNFTSVEVAPVLRRTSTLTGSAIDIKDYVGKMKFILASAAAAAGSSPTLDVKLQDSADGSSGWADISGATFTQVTDAADATEEIGVNIDGVKRYIRAVGTIGGTSTPTFDFGVIGVGAKQVN